MSIKLDRLNHILTEEISKVINEEVKDDDIQFVTITAVDISSDLSYAKVYFTVLDDSKKEEVLKSLNKAANFIEISLSKKIDIRKMPQISFHYDNSYEYGKNIEDKIKEIHAKENK